MKENLVTCGLWEQSDDITFFFTRITKVDHEIFFILHVIFSVYIQNLLKFYDEDKLKYG